MTRTLIAGARIIDPREDSDLQGSILIEDGVIASEPAGGWSDLDADLVIDGTGKWVLPGLVDMHVHLRTPGCEDAESLQTGLMAAVAGGVTTVGMMPNTEPPLDSPEMISELLGYAESLQLARVIPICCLTSNRAGKRLVDFQSLLEMGVRAFTDDGSPLADSGLLREALFLSGSLDFLVIEHPETAELSAGGSVNSGPLSLRLGVEGIPEAGENADVARCIELARDTGGRLHLTHLSSPRSLELVDRARASDGELRLSCDVTPHHLALEESALLEKGTLAKMNPPLRSEESRRRLVELAASGVADCIGSDHAPHTAESKKRPLEEAPFGVTGLETMLAVSLEALCEEGGMEEMGVIRMLTVNPSLLLGIDPPGLAAGEPANLVLYDPHREYVPTAEGFFSRSANSPFIGDRLKGRIEGVWNRRLLYMEGSFEV